MMSENEKKKTINMINTCTWIVSHLLLIKGVIVHRVFCITSHTFVIETVVYIITLIICYLQKGGNSSLTNCK